MSAPKDGTPGPAGIAETADETRQDTAVIDVPPGRRALSCGGCGEEFASAGSGGRGLFLAEALRDAALTAGWQQDDDGTWTCSVCLAKANAPEPEPAAPESEPEAAPDGDHYDQSIALLADFDASMDDFWADTNRSNQKAGLKYRTRLDDGYALIRELAARGVAE